MTNNMEHGEGMTLAAEAMTIVMAYPVSEAVAEFSPYMLDANSPEQLLLSLHAWYRWPLADLASVLLSVHALDTAPDVSEVVLEQSDDTILPMRFHLTTGEVVQTPHKETIIEVVFEHELPDQWNRNGPHTPDQIERRSRITEDIGLYFSEGAVERMRVENPNQLFEAANLIEPFKRYGLRLQDSKRLVEDIEMGLDQSRQRLEELGTILSVDTGIEHMKREVNQEITQWFMALLEELSHITPRPRMIHRIPTRAAADRHTRDDAMVEEASKETQKQLNTQARHAKTDLVLYLHTTPDSGL